MTVRLVNLTPHPLVLVGPMGPYARRDPDGPPARVAEIRSSAVGADTDLGTIPLISLTYAEHIDDLPDPEPGVRYVVSRVTAAALAGHRDDLLFPLDEVRDERGAIVGCRALGLFWTAGDGGGHPTAHARPGATAEG